MTKVRTILAEFCSPKEILAINRLGLVKKEERESQPIPWRHRLAVTERRELVLSEMRTSLKPASRITTRDKTKAVTTARNPKDSRLGECLLNISVREDPKLGSHLGRLNKEKKRLAAMHQQARDTFIKKSKTLNREPLVVVERSPSDHALTDPKLISHLDSETARMPHYMWPLQTRSNRPSMLTTIEAFTLKTRKKRNVWDEVLQEKETPKFKSATIPFTRLTADEVSELKFGHDLHKPRPDKLIMQRSQSGKENSPARPDSNKVPSFFITQMSQKDLSSKSATKLRCPAIHAETLPDSSECGPDPKDQKIAPLSRECSTTSQQIVNKVESAGLRELNFPIDYTKGTHSLLGVTQGRNNREDTNSQSTSK